MDADFDTPVLPGKPKTATVVALLLTAAVTLSYLGAYAISGALVTADVIHAWPSEEDPRPRWMLASVIGLCAIFGFFATIARALSQRQLQRLDASAEE